MKNRRLASTFLIAVFLFSAEGVFDSSVATAAKKKTKPKLTTTKVVNRVTTLKAPASTVAPTTSSPTTSLAPVPVPEVTQSFSGTGSFVTSLFDLDKGVTKIKFSHTGSSNFISFFVDSSGERSEGISNLIGSTTGVTMQELKMGKYAINVKADGAWTFEVSQPRPTTGQAVPPLTLTGTGNDVLGPFKATGALRVAMKHDGTSNFIVVPFTLLGRDGSLANAIGPFAGVQVYKPGGLFFIRLQADGNWSLDFATL